MRNCIQNDMGQHNFVNIIKFTNYYGGYVTDSRIFNKLIGIGYRFSK